MSWRFRTAELHCIARRRDVHRCNALGRRRGAADLVEPAVFASSNGVLDILMIAKAKPVPSLAFTPPDGSAAINPTGWVYEICKRKGSETSCPAGTGTVADYGGVRLALSQGDTLKIRLVNKLPIITAGKLKHVTEPGQANLFLNPTNLHTHGLLTPARAATLRDPTFGDFVFVSVYNSANGIPVPQTTHQHGPIVMDSVDYKIPIPRNHPTGLFWFHPHIHGLSLNQVTQGMAGIITIGKAGDNIRGDAATDPVAGSQRPPSDPEGHPGSGRRHDRLRQRRSDRRQWRDPQSAGPGFLHPVSREPDRRPARRVPRRRQLEG